MTAEREKVINEWCEIHCQICIENLDRGTGYVNCQAECEVQKDIGIACIHYEEAYDIEPQESEDKCKNCEYYRNPDYTRCHECNAESEVKNADITD